MPNISRTLSLLTILLSLAATAALGYSAFTTFQSSTPLRSKIEQLQNVPNIATSTITPLKTKDQALQSLQTLSGFTTSSTTTDLHPLAPSSLQLLTTTLLSTTPTMDPNPTIQPLLAAGWSLVSVSSSNSSTNPSTSIILQQPISTGATK